jgi:Domain of unknown function (DUF4388)
MANGESAVPQERHGAWIGGRNADRHRESGDPRGDRPGPDTTVSDGFSARLSGASLWDLVQMECLARTKVAVRVANGTEVGVLFFEGGKIIHAEARGVRGEGAALEILSWNSGSFEPIEVAWPRSPTILTSSEGLLLRAAQGRDEESASNLVAFPRGTAVSPGLVARSDLPTQSPFAGFSEDEWEQEVTKPTGLDLGTLAGAGRGSVADFPVAVRIAGNGNVVTSTDDQLADAVAYAARLSGLIGDMLGLDGFRAMEWASKTERLFALVEPDGGLVAVRTPIAADVAALRERAGL